MLKDKDIRESLFDYLEIEYGKIRIYVHCEVKTHD